MRKTKRMTRTQLLIGRGRGLDNFTHGRRERGVDREPVAQYAKVVSFAFKVRDSDTEGGGETKMFTTMFTGFIYRVLRGNVDMGLLSLTISFQRNSFHVQHYLACCLVYALYLHQADTLEIWCKKAPIETTQLWYKHFVLETK